MKLLMIILSGVLLVNSQPNKEKFETITHTQVVAQGKVPVVAKKETSKKVSKNVKKAKKKSSKNVKKKAKTVKKVQKKNTTKKKAKKAKRVTYGKVLYNKGEIQNYVHQLVREYGWSEDDYYAVVMIVNHESSWNPNAVNKKSGACGLFQAYPCSKMASYGSDYRTNYKLQARWGLNYIKNRYGTPQKAWSFWQNHHWY